MILVCSNCGKKEGPSATYCRDCYTVFPFEVRASAMKGQERRGSLGAWKWLPLGALIVGTILFFQIDFKDAEPAAQPDSVSEPQVSRTRHAPRPLQGEDKAAWSRLKESRPKHAAGGVPARTRKAKPDAVPAASHSITAAASRYVAWVLKSDATLACPSVHPCPATIRFGSGEQGSYSIERWEGTSNTIVPIDGKASRLLTTHVEATLEMKLPNGRPRSVDLERRANRWMFNGAGDS